MPMDPLQLPTFFAVLACWFAFAGVFLLRRRPPAVAQRVRGNRSVAGIVIVAVGYAVVWSARRRVGTSLVGFGPPLAYVLDAVAVAIAVGSVWLTMAAVKTLGKQWNVRAAVVEGHALVTHGPYGWVRHPIYLGMLGLLVATGQAQSHWAALMVGLVVAVAGTMVRVREEERLLRAEFGVAFEAYRARVPALFPGIY
jgi:protein-S-isoprenylcysteine O-methyltransferase Ste14